MEILFVGVFNKPWSTCIPMVQELRKQKHNVKIFDIRTIDLKFRKISNKFYIKLISALIYRIDKMQFLPSKLKMFKYYVLGNRGMNKSLLSETINKNYDLIILAKAANVNYKLIPKLNSKTRTFYFFMDSLYVGIIINAHLYAKLSTWSSSTFTNVNLFFKKEGANSYFLTQGLDTKIFKPSNKIIHKDIEVIFVGSITPKREKYIKFLKKNKINVICFGLGWEYKPIYLKKLVDKYRTSKIILNFTRGNIGFSIRIFQVMGAGSFLLSEYCRDLENLFRKEVHLDWFNSKEECLKLIRFYLKNEEIREKIAQQGYKYVQQNFTWEQIIRKLIEITKKKI